MNENLSKNLKLGVKVFATAVALIIFIYGLNRIGDNLRYELRKPDQAQMLKQLAVENGLAWYNPTNGIFEIRTNRVVSASVVFTIADVVEVSKKAWIEASARGLSTAFIDSRVIAADNLYQKSSDMAKAALESGDVVTYQKMFKMTKALASDLIDIIIPQLQPLQATKILADLDKVNSL